MMQPLQDLLASLPLVRAELPVYRASAQHFQIASFETGNHLVYVISNLNAQQNTEQLLAVAPAVRDFLATIPL